jgi:RNA polymerase sigma-70 factor, ECF subfamily
MDIQSTSGAAAPFSTSSGLLQRAKEHEPESWRRLSYLYGPAVYRWGRQCGLQPSDAADIAQEVFCAVWTGLPGFRKDRPGDSFRGWLWTITRNKVRDFARRRAALPHPAGGDPGQRNLEQIADALDSEVAPPRLQVEAVHRSAELVKSEFEPPTWQAFWLTAVEGRKGTDVAEELGMSVGAVYMAKSRVLRRLREELDGLFD